MQLAACGQLDSCLKLLLRSFEDLDKNIVLILIQEIDYFDGESSSHRPRLAGAASSQSIVNIFFIIFGLLADLQCCIY